MAHQARTNWAGNQSFEAETLRSPGTLSEIQALLSEPGLLKPLGTGHSFNRIADSPDCQLSTQLLDRIVELNIAAETVTIEGGVRYGELCPILDRAGYALSNLASLPHISIAGACATGTHGSGDRNRSLAASVSSIEIVSKNGAPVVLSRDSDGDRFCGAVVNLGALGVVTRLTLDLVPRFEVQQEVSHRFHLSDLIPQIDQVLSDAYSVSVFTNWRDPLFNQIWFKRRVGDEPGGFDPLSLGAQPAVGNQHPIAGFPADSCSQQLGVPGPWYNRLPHFRLDHTPSAGSELQSEYFVPRELAAEALRRVEQLSAVIHPHLLISEVRSVAADELWMSPCFERDSVGIHFTWKKEWEAVRSVLPLIEGALHELDARPHWAKLFTIDAERLAQLFPRLEDFRELVREFDGEGRFRNDFLNTKVLGVPDTLKQ